MAGTGLRPAAEAAKGPGEAEKLLVPPAGRERSARVAAAAAPALALAVTALASFLAVAALASASTAGRAAAAAASRNLEDEAAAGSLLPHVQVAPYGVLGVQLQTSGSMAKAAAEPGEHTAVVDPAGLPFIQELGPRNAGGASGAIYRWLGIRAEGSFPAAVRQAVRSPGDAKLHSYGGQAVIHVVGPDLRGASSEGKAVEELAEAYAGVLSEFLSSDASRLRLLPVSGGVYAGDFRAELPRLTFRALDRGFRTLPAPQRQALLRRLGARTAEMCIFAEAELHGYQAACPTCGGRKA